MQMGGPKVLGGKNMGQSASGKRDLAIFGFIYK